MATFTLNRLPAADVTGLTLQGGIKSAALSWDAILGSSFEVWAGATNDVTQATKLTSTDSNSFFATGLEQDTYFFVRSVNEYGTFGQFTDSAFYEVQLVTSNDVDNSTVATAIGVSVGAGASSSTLSAYGTWTAAAAGSFGASANAIYTISIAAFIDMSSVTGTGQEVYVRSRLYDTTLKQDVPAGMKTYLIYSNPFGTARGAMNQVFNVNENYVCGFRGLLTPGHSYTLYAEVSKVQANGGTGTLSVQVGGKVTSSGGASI